MDTDVLIIGAGRTGLMLANQLARRGVKPVIIDRHSGPRWVVCNDRERSSSRPNNACNLSASTAMSE